MLLKQNALRTIRNICNELVHADASCYLFKVAVGMLFRDNYLTPNNEQYLPFGVIYIFFVYR